MAAPRLVAPLPSLRASAEIERAGRGRGGADTSGSHSAPPMPSAPQPSAASACALAPRSGVSAHTRPRAASASSAHCGGEQRFERIDASCGRKQGRASVCSSASDTLRPPEVNEFLGLASAAADDATATSGRRAASPLVTPRHGARVAPSPSSPPRAPAFAAGGDEDAAFATGERSPSPPVGRRAARTSTENSVVKITNSLRHARRQARMRQLLVHRPVLIASALLVAAGVAWHVAGWVVATLARGQAVDVGNALVLSGLALAIVSLLPADRAIISTCAFATGALVPCALAAARAAACAAKLGALVEASAGARGAGCPWLGARCAPLCADALRGPVPCWYTAVHASTELLAGACLVLCAARCARAVSLRLPPRAVLDALWPAYGLALAGTLVADALVFLCAAGAGLLARPASRAHDIGRPLYLALVLALAVAFLAPPVRHAVHAWLTSRGEAVTTAAAISAMIGSRQPEEVHALAEATFRAVSLADVTFAEFSSSAPASAEVHGLARPVRIGEVDSFVSHSWSDDPVRKWAELQEWRHEFRAQNSREPICFIDKYCLDQSAPDIDARLACLPVFLAGCDTLLVLCGPSYLSRLWCVIELMVWLEMGGAISAITLRPLLPMTDDADDNSSDGGEVHGEDGGVVAERLQAVGVGVGRGKMMADGGGGGDSDDGNAINVAAGSLDAGWHQPVARPAACGPASGQGDPHHSCGAAACAQPHAVRAAWRRSGGARIHASDSPASVARAALGGWGGSCGNPGGGCGSPGGGGAGTARSGLLGRIGALLARPRGRTSRCAASAQPPVGAGGAGGAAQRGRVRNLVGAAMAAGVSLSAAAASTAVAASIAAAAVSAAAAAAALDGGADAAGGGAGAENQSSVANSRASAAEGGSRHGDVDGGGDDAAPPVSSAEWPVALPLPPPVSILGASGDSLPSGGEPAPLAEQLSLGSRPSTPTRARNLSAASASGALAAMFAGGGGGGGGGGGRDGGSQPSALVSPLLAAGACLSAALATFSPSAPPPPSPCAGECSREARNSAADGGGGRCSSSSVPPTSRMSSDALNPTRGWHASVDAREFALDAQRAWREHVRASVVRYRFATFDVHACECALAAERERLLDVIEAGFGYGSLAGFNELIRHALLRAARDASATPPATIARPTYLRSPAVSRTASRRSTLSGGSVCSTGGSIGASAAAAALGAGGLAAADAGIDVRRSFEARQSSRAEAARRSEERRSARLENERRAVLPTASFEMRRSSAPLPMGGGGACAGAMAVRAACSACAACGGAACASASGASMLSPPSASASMASDGAVGSGALGGSLGRTGTGNGASSRHPSCSSDGDGGGVGGGGGGGGGDGAAMRPASTGRGGSGASPAAASSAVSLVSLRCSASSAASSGRGRSPSAGACTCGAADPLASSAFSAFSSAQLLAGGEHGVTLFGSGLLPASEEAEDEAGSEPSPPRAAAAKGGAPARAPRAIGELRHSREERERVFNALDALEAEEHSDELVELFVDVAADALAFAAPSHVDKVVRA